MAGLSGRPAGKGIEPRSLTARLVVEPVFVVAGLADHRSGGTGTVSAKPGASRLCAVCRQSDAACPNSL